jgi:predicted enzyme related to lactoylglutathione lyase
VHRSRLTAALIDVPPGDYDRETSFWSAAVGATIDPDTEDPDYAEFGEVLPGLIMMVQRVGAPARVHLDIETDDVEAEVARLEALGATRVQQVKTWWVMRDPAGLLFCVVRVQNPEAFDRGARTWT